MQSTVVPAISEKTVNEDRSLYLTELQQFRYCPSSIVSYLKTRCSRYKIYEDSLYFVSQRQRRKVIELHEKQIQANTKHFVNKLLSQTLTLPKLIMIPKLDQIAMKLCQTIEPQMCNDIQYKPQSSKILREVLDDDKDYYYPSEVLSLVSLSFDQAYQPLATLLIDDGLPNRPNRSILLDPKYKYGGFASVKSKTDPELRCTVYILAEQAVQKKSMVSSNSNLIGQQMPNSSQIYNGNSQWKSNFNNTQQPFYEQSSKSSSQFPSAYRQQTFNNNPNTQMPSNNQIAFQKYGSSFEKKNQLSQSNSVYKQTNFSNAESGIPIQQAQQSNLKNQQNYGPSSPILIQSNSGKQM